MALRAYTWNKSTGGTGNWNVAGNWTGVGSGYPGDGGGDDSATFPTGMEPCTVNTAVTIKDLTINSDHSGADVIMAANLTCTGNVLLTQGELQTGNYDFNVSGTTDIYGTLTPGSSTCYFGYGNTASSGWDLSVRGTGVLNAGTGDWYAGGVGFYTDADVSLTSGILYISGTHSGYSWSPDQGVGSWDNRDGTVIIQNTSNIRTAGENPLTASDTQICPFHTLIISGGADRTDAPVVTLNRGLKIDDELIIKNGVLKWSTIAGAYGDVWAVNGTELTGLASQSAAIVFDDMPARSMFVSATGSSPTGDGFYCNANAIVSGATAKIHAGNWWMGTDGGNSNSADNKAITGLNGTPYFAFPSGEACAIFDGTNDYLQIPDSLDYPAEMTVSAWVKRDNATQDGTEIVIFNNGAAEARGTLLQTRSTDGIRVIHNDAGGDYYLIDHTAGTDLPDDTWVHVAMTFTSTGTPTLTLYVNGTAVATDTTGTGDTHSVESNSTIGKLAWSGGGRYWAGSIAYVRVYNECKDASSVAALAATNPATSTTGSYPDTGSGLKGWWKLEPLSIINGTGSGDMDFSDSSDEGNDATNNGTVTGWGGLWLYNQGSTGYCAYSYQRSFIGNNTIPAGVEGRGSTTYIKSQAADLNLVVNDGDAYDAVTQYNNGRALKFNNLNILPRAGGGVGTVQWGANAFYFSGLLDLTGDLFVASGSKLRAHIGNLSGLQRAAMATGYLYVSGNARLYGDLDVNPTSYITALADGEIPTMPQVYVEDSIHIYGDANYNATSYLTITRDNPGMAREDSTATFTHNSGTYIFADKADGGWGLGSNGWTGSNTFYNFIISGTNLYKSQPVNVDNDMTLKNCTAADPNFRPYVQPTYIGGNVNVESGCGFGNWYIASAAYNAPIYISGNLNMNGGDLYLSGDGGKDFHIYGSLYNRGGEIFDSEA